MLEHAKTFEQELVCEQITRRKPQVISEGQTGCELFQKAVTSLWIQSKKGGLSADEQTSEAPPEIGGFGSSGKLWHSVVKIRNAQWLADCSSFGPFCLTTPVVRDAGRRAVKRACVVVGL